MLPGRVHRVIYERMVDDTEAEVRRLLEYCGLPFEEACLRFYENERAVRTREFGAGAPADLPAKAWTSGSNYEPWLGPLKDALGPVLDAYPDCPAREPRALN